MDKDETDDRALSPGALRRVEDSHTQAWAGPEAETVNDIISAEDDTGSETRPECITENTVLSHLNEQPLFHLGGAQTFRCASKFFANGIKM
eukprot:6188086-Pleurochrysis_carterae.AAC.2